MAQQRLCSCLHLSRASCGHGLRPACLRSSSSRTRSWTRSSPLSPTTRARAALPWTRTPSMKARPRAACCSAPRLAQPHALSSHACPVVQGRPGRVRAGDLNTIVRVEQFSDNFADGVFATAQAIVDPKHHEDFRPSRVRGPQQSGMPAVTCRIARKHTHSHTCHAQLADCPVAKLCMCAFAATARATWGRCGLCAGHPPQDLLSSAVCVEHGHGHVEGAPAAGAGRGSAAAAV